MATLQNKPARGNSQGVLGETGARLPVITLYKLAFLAAGLLLLGLGLWYVDFVVWLDPQRIIPTLEHSGSLAPIVFMLMMAVAVVVSPIPSWPLDVAAGLAFGPWLGTFYAVVGAEIGGVTSFLVARWLGRNAVRRLLNPDAWLCPDCSDKVLARAIFVMRLLPSFSFDLVSYAAGLTSIRLRPFATATFLGMLLPTFVIVSAGRELLLVGGVVGKIVAALAMAALLLSPIVARRLGWLGATRVALAEKRERQCRGCSHWFHVPVLRLSPVHAGLVVTLIIGVLVALLL